MLSQIIKLLVAFALTSTLVMMIIPSSEYHFGWYSCLLGSVAFVLVVLRAYRTEAGVQTRGGFVSKKQTPLQYLVAHILLGMFGLGLLIISTLGALGLMT